MARKARSTSKSRQAGQPNRHTGRVRGAGRNMPKRSAPSRLDFHEARALKGAYFADTVSYHYAIKPGASGWDLRIYERTNGSGEGQQPGGHELFASHSKTMSSKSACIALAQAFHNLGGSFSEFAHGYRSRFSQALLDVENPAQKASVPAPPRLATSSSPPTASAAVPNSPNSSNQTGASKPTVAPTAVSKSTSGPSATHKQRRTSSPRHHLSEAELRRAVAVARKPVYVNREDEHFHTAVRCKGDRKTTHWCQAADAYRSHLRPCPRCAISLAKDLERYLSADASYERRPLQLFRIGSKAQPVETIPKRKNPRSKRGTPGRRTASRRDGTVAYGAPTNVDDIRFSHRTATEWGTSSFRQHPEEFLGTSTEDDHDWRGGNSLYE